ncbi:nascent polypeptide-associated complex protein [Methanobrevibacter sp.]|uniref:nascent polypeptide-associated complex protein n=1 Tax=Methanobrevibacter sp. TaxID=66852 RepID=UPI0025E13892|nr:nascent polypeptide-associated complex protein [Methanobrevibacter sp.]MBR4448121.1 nascent polypeptide-associated complex protein [Methanobrevibacter sp.]
MIPGMNKKQMKQMERQMKKMGMKMDELQGVQEVIIRFEDKELIIDNPNVSLMNIMGQETYQVEGKAREVELEYEIEIPDEDVEMVANSAGVSADKAREALEECKGDLAEAIMKLNQ